MKLAAGVALLTSGVVTMVDKPEYGLKLCDALMKVLGAGPQELSAIAEGLNQSDVAPANGTRWTADLLSEELRNLAQSPEKKVYSPAGQARIDHGDGGGEIAPSLPKAASADERSEYLVRHGLRNLWYVVAASEEVTNKPIGITRLDERMVLWRDEQGKVHALADRCPHRGVALSIGEVHGGVITCGYHGVQVDGSGRVVSVPAVTNCPLEGRRLVRSYPIIEHYQAIWAYFGDETHPLPPPLELPEELTSPEWTGMLHQDVWNAHYQYIFDNLCDPMHGPYLHGRTYTQQYGPKSDKIKVEQKEHGIEVFREGQRGINFDWMELVYDDSNHYCRVEIPLPPTAGPGGPMQIIFYVTPIDDRHTRIHVWRLRKVSGWQRDLWHFLFKYRLRGFVDAVLAQDRVAMDAMPPWPAPENLYQHDIGVVRMRRHMREVANSQASALFAKAD